MAVTMQLQRSVFNPLGCVIVTYLRHQGCGRELAVKFVEVETKMYLPCGKLCVQFTTVNTIEKHKKFKNEVVVPSRGESRECRGILPSAK